MNATFTTGFMSSGKSKTLIEKFNKDESVCIAFAAKLDSETGSLGKIESRNGQSVFALNLNSSNPQEVTKLVKNLLDVPDLETVYIDEVQFLDKVTVSTILNYAIQNNTDIHFFGLDTTFTGELFESSRFLLENLNEEKIERISMKCQHENCEEDAAYNARIVDGKVAREGETFVSSKSKYLAFCKKHYFE